MWNTSSLVLFPRPLGPGVVVNVESHLWVKLKCLIIYNSRNHLTVCKQMINIELLALDNNA